MELPIHGSNPKYLYEYFQIPMDDKREILDFSVNLNPFGPPEEVREKWGSWLEEIMDYPDPLGEQVTALIAENEEINVNQILLGNGGAELIRQIANVFAKQKVVLIQPTFSEYERVCRTYGCEITYFTLNSPTWALNMEQLEKELVTHDVLFLCHPNNPTGMTYPKKAIEALAQKCQEHDCYLVLDEAFDDFLIHPYSMANLVETNDHVIIIRSLTKMYAIAGLRLGYVIANEKMVDELRQYQSYWSVNAIALLAGEAILKNRHIARDAREYFSRQREYIFPILKNAGYMLSDSKVNYFLLRDPSLEKQTSLLTFLLKKGIVARHTFNYPGLDGKWLRFAIRTESEMNRLLEVLKSWKED